MIYWQDCRQGSSRRDMIVQPLVIWGRACAAQRAACAPRAHLAPAPAGPAARSGAPQCPMAGGTPAQEPGGDIFSLMQCGCLGKSHCPARGCQHSPSQLASTAGRAAPPCQGLTATSGCRCSQCATRAGACPVRRAGGRLPLASSTSGRPTSLRHASSDLLALSSSSSSKLNCSRAGCGGCWVAP